MDKIVEMLDREYESTLQAVSRATTGSEEAKWQLQKLSELYKQRLGAEQAGTELNLRTQELELKRTQVEEGKKDRIVKIVLEGIAVLIPASVSCFWMAKGLKFEETGAFTSRTCQWIGNHLRLFKK